MYILLIGLILAVALLFVGRFWGHRQERILKQYEILEKRFGFKRRTHKSRWGDGIGERYTLEGRFRGYPVSLYNHFLNKEQKKLEWTSLVMETLFAEELSIDIEFENTEKLSKFEKSEAGSLLDVTPGVQFRINRMDAEGLLNNDLVDRLETFSKKQTCGAFRLSKGFLEYRETGMLTEDVARARFQDALLLLAHLADAVSLYMVEKR